MTGNAPYLTPADVARRLGVTTATVRLMNKRGKLSTAATTESGIRLFAVADVVALVAARAHLPSTPQTASLGVVATASLERVYVAAPVTTYETRSYKVALKRVCRLLAKCEVLEARKLYASNDDWRRKWPAILPTISRLVFLADSEGWIGNGVWTEIGDARGRSIPVEWWSPDKTLVPIRSVRFTRPNVNDWTKHVHVSRARRGKA